MRRRRFKVSDICGSVITVTGAEANHALRVLRLRVGDLVTLFDGADREVDGRILAESPGGFEVEVTGGIHPRARPLSRFSLAVATPKGPRSDWLVEKCAELGVRVLYPIQTARGAVLPGEGRLERWRRKAVEAAKQSGQAHVMSIESPRSIEAICGTKDTPVSIFYGDSGAGSPSLSSVLLDMQESSEGAGDILILVGPEGGFTDDESRQIAELGGVPVRLSSSVLRVETAAVAAASVWASWAVGMPED